MIQIKRVYDPYEEKDGVRILVDRMWPRGLKKETAHLDRWARSVAPSTDLRKRFHGGQMTYEDFSAAYREELNTSPAALEFMTLCRYDVCRGKTVTLLYASRDQTENHALVLLKWLGDTIR